MIDYSLLLDLLLFPPQHGDAGKLGPRVPAVRAYFGLLGEGFKIKSGKCIRYITA